VASERERFHYATDHAAALAVSTDSGAVTVHGERRRDVALTVRRTAADDDGLDATATDVSLVDGTLRVTAVVDRESTGSREPRVDLELQVPRSLPIDRAVAPNGDLEVRQVAAVGRAHAANGAVTVAGVDGDVLIVGTDGAVVATEVGGRVDAETTSGALTVEQAGGPVAARSATGDVTVTDVDANVSVETADGDIVVRSVAGDASLETDGDATIAGVDGTVRR